MPGASTPPAAVWPPEGYEEVVLPNQRAVVQSQYTEWITAVGESGATLHEWAERQPDRVTFTGRGRVFSVPAPGPGGAGTERRWAVRHYIRGGAAAMHLGDRYLRVGRPRPFREVAASEWARSRGVRTPGVIAASMYPDGPFYRADIVTVEVEGTSTLADRLHETDGERGWLEAMASAGDLIRSLASIGLYHVDLNARNILIESDSADDPWIIDLDRARVLARPSRQAAERMLDRLTRSIAKTGTPTGERLGTREILAALATRRAEL